MRNIQQLRQIFTPPRQCFWTEVTPYYDLHSPYQNITVVNTTTIMHDDILDSVLDLEEDSYRSGFEEGKADGEKAGYEEGLVFGTERGYIKALEMGKLHGRALMLQACLCDRAVVEESVSSRSPRDTVAASTAIPDAAMPLGGNPESVSESDSGSDPEPLSEREEESESESTGGTAVPSSLSLPIISSNQRLKKHVETLLRLTDINTLSTQNTDEAVNEFDDRMKKALAKAKVIDKLIAGPYGVSVSGDQTDRDPESQSANAADAGLGAGSIEEISNLAVRR
jgi:hypothetical protein